MSPRDIRALRLLRRAVAGNPDDGAAWQALGVASLRGDDATSARIHFSRATALLPQSVAAWHGLGWSCLLLQDGSAALSAFRQALALDLQQAESHGCMAVALRCAGREPESLSYLASADALDPATLCGRAVRSLQPGRPPAPSDLAELAMQLLDRRGLFGGRPGRPVDG